MYFGSAQPDTIADLLIQPEAPSTGFFGQVAGGDINADGTDDIIIGGYSTGWISGQVLGYLGGPNLNEHYDYLFNSGINNGLGTTIGLSDINGDSIYEILAGASQHQSPNYWGPGQVWLFSTQNVPSVQYYRGQLPNQFFLTLYSNPSNSTIAIHYNLLTNSYVRLTIYDLLGNKVRVLVTDWQRGGQYVVLLNLSDLPSGVYFTQLITGDVWATRKLLLMK